MKSYHPEIPRKEVADFCRRHFIRKMSLFGSALRGEATSDSDLDFLVEFRPDRLPNLIELAAMERELSEILERPVDLRTAEDLSRHFREQVVAEAEIQYAE